MRTKPAGLGSYGWRALSLAPRRNPLRFITRGMNAIVRILLGRKPQTLLWGASLSASLIFYSALCAQAWAKEITLLYTGETHAMLYRCNCPKESDGGVARRATMIKQMRKAYPDALVLDSGGFFAGGMMDEYSQNTQLDMQRSRINFASMALMNYDAVALGDEELNFGWGFLRENMNKARIAFLSCNIKADKVLPYIIKDIGGVKLGIIGVTSPVVAAKTTDLTVAEPKNAVRQAIAELRKKGVPIIVVLSHLGEDEDVALINEVKGIDILITGHALTPRKTEAFVKIQDTIVLRPSWQGRRLGRMTFTVKDNRIVEYNVEDMRVSDKYADDPGTLSLLPSCFSDNDCRKEGLVGACQNAGTLGAQCLFNEASKVPLLVVTLKDCSTCDTKPVVDFLKNKFPGLSVSYMYYPEQKTEKFMKDFSLVGLPVYLLGKEVEKEKNFSALKGNIEPRGDYYMLKPHVSGISYFPFRQKVKGRIDLFLSLYEKDAAGLLEAIKDLGPMVHFLTREQKGTFDAARGTAEVEEYLRAVCVQKYYPARFWNYIICRAKNIESSWWDDCAENIDPGRIKTCARGQESQALLRENINLGKELDIMFGLVYLKDNQEIFSTQGVPTKDDLKKIFQR